MIELLIAAVYVLMVARIKFTPVFSSLTWINVSIVSPFFSWLKKIFRKKPKQQEIIEDAFAIPVTDKKANTLAKKFADKGGDEFAKFATELGKMFVDVDMRIKIFFSVLLFIFFITGICYHIKWAFTYPKILCCHQ